MLWIMWLLDRALDTKTDEIVALKKMRMENEKDGKIVMNQMILITHLFAHVETCMFFNMLCGNFIVLVADVWPI